MFNCGAGPRQPGPQVVGDVMRTEGQLTPADINKIEVQLGSPLPQVYKSTLLDYPFAQDSFGSEFMLPNEADELLNLNKPGLPIQGVSRPFLIGNDGGEEYYFIDLSLGESPVFVFQLETGTHRVVADTWIDYLDQIRRVHKEIEADEEAERQRRATKRWWEFWK